MSEPVRTARGQELNLTPKQQVEAVFHLAKATKRKADFIEAKLRTLLRMDDRVLQVLELLREMRHRVDRLERGTERRRPCPHGPTNHWGRPLYPTPNPWNGPGGNWNREQAPRAVHRNGNWNAPQA